MLEMCGLTQNGSDMKKIDTIAACPFCGGQGVVCKQDQLVYVTCLSCFAQGEKFTISADICANDEAIKSWNRRVYGDS